MKGYETEPFKEVQEFFKVKGYPEFADMVEENSNNTGRYVTNWRYSSARGIVIVVFNNFDIDIYQF